MVRLQSGAKPQNHPWFLYVPLAHETWSTKTHPQCISCPPLPGVLCKPKSPSSVPRPLAGVSSVLSSHSRWRNLFKQPYSGTTVLVPTSVPASYCIRAQIPSVIYEVQCLCSSWPPVTPYATPTLYSLFLFLFLASRALPRIFPPLAMVSLWICSWFASHHSFWSLIILASKRSSLTSLCKYTLPNTHHSAIL